MIFGTLLLSTGVACGEDKPITLESLLHEMIDRDGLAHWPDPAFTAKEFTSYDRKSVAPDQPGWFAKLGVGGTLPSDPQVIAYFVGDRSAESARALRERIPPSYRCRATRSDSWLADAEVFPARTHRLCDKSEGETCHVERWHNTLRQRLGRFVRQTLSFSKCDRMHKLALRLFIHEYNQQPII